MATFKTSGMALLKLDFATLRAPGGRCQPVIETAFTDGRHGAFVGPPKRSRTNGLFET